MCAQFQRDMKVFVILVLCVLVASAERNNVCSKIVDYDFKWLSKNCWYNSDVVLSVPDIILKHEYPLEVYEVTTQDGYILQLYRIPHGKNATKPKNGKLQPVLLQHGIAASSAPWVVVGNKSIGFILADEGYDVWLANSRGSTYGKGHIKLSVHDTRYWNFSHHEMGIFDLPKTLDLIYKVTSRKDIIIIGQSMGTNIQLVYASELPEHARRRVKFMVYLAPTIFLGFSKTPAVKMLPLWPTIYKSARKLGIGEIFSKEQFSGELLTKLCLQTGTQVITCELMIFTIFGVDFENLPPEITPLILGHYPGGASLKNLDHLVQSTISNKFTKYDYGPSLNTKYYHTTKPPDYQLSRIEIPGLIIYGDNDYLATKEGSLQLYKELPKTNSIFEIKDSRYNHIDFFFGRTVVEEIINPMLNVMNKYKITLA